MKETGLTEPMTKLKPCPFCGSRNTHIGLNQATMNTAWFVVCDNCRTEGPVSMVSQDQAERFWNQRAGDGG